VRRYKVKGTKYEGSWLQRRGMPGYAAFATLSLLLQTESPFQDYPNILIDLVFKMKSDQSIRNICIAAIKRKTIPPFDFPYTSIYGDGDVIKNTEVRKAIVLQESELLICSTIVHEKLWTVLTTRRIFSYEGFGVMQHMLMNIKKWD
jgi:hypothetical protein